MRIPYKYLIFCILFVMYPCCSYGEDPQGDVEKAPAFSISGDMNETMAREAAKVREELKNQARTLFEHEPFKWNADTIVYIYKWGLTLPMKIPELTRTIVEQSKVLGVIGSLVMLTFLIAIFYSIIGQKRVLKRIKNIIQPFRKRIPNTVYPYLISALKVVIAAFIPLILWLFYSFLNALIAYEAAWFGLLGDLLKLWAAGSLVISLMHELLTENLIPNTALYGKSIYRSVRLVIYYVLTGLAIFAVAQNFHIRSDVLALLKFIISISIVIVLFLLFLNKKALLSLLPEWPYQGWQKFCKGLEKYYYPVIFASLFFAFLWCIGYKKLGEAVLLKSWLTAGAFMLIVMTYHLLQRELVKLARKSDPADEAAQLLIKSARTILVYAAVLGTFFIVLNLLGLLGPLQRLMSFNVFRLGNNTVTFWIIIKAILILVAIIFLSRVLQAYLDYKIYPSLGVDAGLAYALNTFLKYLSLIIGILISLKIVGIDLRLLMVFAGAIGIGIGLGLQNMAGNIISGFTIIFGGKIRKGDWIEVSGTLGMVTDILLWATKVRTRDNIEYFVPNTDFISNVTVNYSLSSPYVRMALPVGVSYDADPREVEKILVTVAENEPLVNKYENPSVRFVGYGDSSIDFQLLFWIDIRTTPRRRVRSELYFAAFEALKASGIEIPFPQRDIHIKSPAKQS